MEKPGFGLDDKSTTCHQKIQLCIKCIVHACQCRDTNCQSQSCRKMKRVIQHDKSCKQKLCRICKPFIALCVLHAKNCQEAKCPVPHCINIKNKLKHQQQRIQHGKRLFATIQNSWRSGVVLQTSPGNSNSSSQSSPVAQPHSSPHPPQPGIGLKPTTAPPAGALQAIQQVQAAATSQTASHMVVAFVYYGKGQQSLDECIICYEKPVDCALYRCGHTCMCYNCALKLWKSSSTSHCPICRSSIQDVLKIYK